MINGGSMKEYIQQFLSGERALFQAADCRISYCTFADGESPLKESHDLEIDNTLFRWKYPLWYAKNVVLSTSCPPKFCWWKNIIH